MTLNIDLTQLTKAAENKVTYIDNCVVTSIGSGAFPRQIEVRAPGVDGALLIAVNNQLPLVAVNDEVLISYSGDNQIARVEGYGLGTALDILVSKLISPDGTVDPVFSADNSGDVTLAGTGDIIAPDKIIHSGDTDTNIAFTDDDIEFTSGALSMLKLTETTQDLITLGPGSGDVDIDFNGDMFLRGSDGQVGIGTASPDTLLHLENATTPTLRIQDTTTASSYLDFIDSSGTQSKIEKVSASGQALIDINPFPSDNAGDALFRFFRRTNTSGTVSFQVFRGDGTSTFDAQIAAGNTDSFISVPSASEFGVGTSTPAAKLHVDQAGTGEAKPVALFDQADVSEEMFEFVSTIGTGNAIEAVGAKTLTVTHFIKVTLPGSLTRYFAVGTIA